MSDPPRRFLLIRDEDVTGVSGIGIVATGVLFPPTQHSIDETAWTQRPPKRHVALEWTTAWPTSIVFHDRGVESLEHVHGHGGKTRIVWLDPEGPEAES